MPKTYNELYLNARRAFREAGISSYNLEARLILCQATGKSVDKLMQDMQFYTSDAVTAEVEQLVQRAGGNIVGRACILAEGDAIGRKDIIYLQELPLIFPEK